MCVYSIFQCTQFHIRIYHSAICNCCLFSNFSPNDAISLCVARSDVNRLVVQEIYQVSYSICLLYEWLCNFLNLCPAEYIEDIKGITVFKISILGGISSDIRSKI